MLSSVFRNLLVNAVQHNDSAEPTIEITCERRASDVLVRIADNGPGIPESQTESLFRKGAKGPESTGTGIGLHLVKSLVDQYGGDVRAEANEPRGTVFTVELPLAE